MTGMEPIWIGAAAKGLADIVVKPLSEVLNRRLDEPFKQLLYNVFGTYIQNYNERHGLLKVLGMPEPVQLENIYTAVQFIDGSENWQFDPNRLEEAYRQSQERRFQGEQCEKKDGLAVANQKQYLMVLGQPGAGKSTFLRRIGLEALKGTTGSYVYGYVPVFLELKQFRTGGVDLEQAIAHEFETCGFPNPVPATQKLLANGKLLVLLDGLDEVPTQQLDAAIEKIQDFADKYKQNRFIASCRTAAYQSRFRKFVDVIVAEFDDDQIQQFISNWFRAEKDKQAGTAQRCWELLQTPNHAGTKELAQTPLLLTLLCLVYDDTQDFPEKRAELYKQALDVLLTKWAAEKRIQRDPIYKDLTLTLETLMLGEIAYRSFAANRLFFWQQEVVGYIQNFLANNLNAPRHLDGGIILQAIQIQQGILVERTRNILSFSHLTLKEYLSAQHIVDQDRADNPLIDQLLQKHFIEKRWREVWLLVAGLMRGGTDLLLLSMERQVQNYLLNPKIKALITWTVKVTQGSEDNFNPTAKRILAVMLPLDLKLVLAHNYDHDRALDIDIARTIDIARKYFLDYARTIDVALVHDIAIVHDRALARDSDLVDLTPKRALALALARDITRARALEKMKIFRTVDFLDLIHKLEALSPLVSHQDFLNQWSKTWCQSLHLDPEWLNLSGSEANTLIDYFYINELMVQCKDAAASVSPQTWEGIEARMLTLNPPPS
jgi:NACHT domain